MNLLLLTPPLQVQWLFNNEAIVPGLYRTSCLGEVHSLHIPKVGDGDVGRFSVIAENDAGWWLGGFKGVFISIVVYNYYCL